MHILLTHGGWDGHTPKECAKLFDAALRDRGHTTSVTDTLDVYTDADAMAAADVIVPIWTMSEITDDQWKGLDAAVHAGTGLAGFHGGVLDSFRQNVDYQWMIGAQWVAHPGDIIPEHRVTLTDRDHPITAGLDDFTLPNTEQYYCHVDPSNHVLATTTLDGGHGDTTRYPQPGSPTGPVTMPYAHIRHWGRGRVFAAYWGHTFKDFDVPEAKEIILRGIEWAGGAASAS